MKTQLLYLLTLSSAALLSAQSTPYSSFNETTHPTDPAIASSNPGIVQWASGVVDYSPATNVPLSSSWQNPSNALGAYNTSIVSLGELSAADIANGVAPGSITLSFTQPIYNGAGADLAVFENGFAFGTPNGLFAEFGFVEVSSNGVDFVRFPSLSLNDAALPGGFGSAFSGFDVTNVYNLAGKHSAGFGTPFDFDDLAGDALVTSGLVDLDSISFVRIVDIPGDGSFVDSEGNPILDNWATTGSGGFDLAAIGAFYASPLAAVPEPETVTLFLGLAALGCVLLGRRKA
ncbi:MAG: PEP-CTERM sorting domain-containing protein [Verrucomicrobiota bacterium JB022]|nr:PEP-CTERM sorting domain-containing protein [Verrucomicrobiota bacterium JB022]